MNESTLALLCALFKNIEYRIRNNKKVFTHSIDELKKIAIEHNERIKSENESKKPEAHTRRGMIKA